MAFCLLLAAQATAAPIVPPRPTNAAIAWQQALERFQARAERRARGYDRTQDIRPSQLLTLLDVAARTGYSLGQLLATGEHESAHTWNDFVRPPLGGGRLGSAAGVWQFQPRTFERVIHLYGAELLALTAADPARGRRRLDLGFGPFCDAHVRMIVRDTMAGLRGPDDTELRLLRHNFTVLAVAKYLLSKDSGAADPVEDYLFHFLGAAEGRRVLTLARGEDKHTRTVKPPPLPEPTAPTGASAGTRIRDTLPGRPALLLELAPKGYKQLTPGAAPAPGARAADAVLRRPGESPPARTAMTHWPAPHGFAHDSPVVTGNAGMFYRDGQGRSDPYTWAELLAHLERRVQADRQPQLVRAKYGVGFALTGGDMPQWTFEPQRPGPDIELQLAGGEVLALPRAKILAPLSARETRDYQRRLAALIALGEAAPATHLSDAAARVLWRLGLLTPAAAGDDPMAAFATDMGPGWGMVVRTEHPAVRKALHAFRELVGKSAPEDPAQADLLLPAERVALEVYGARIERILATKPRD
ncbi:MAG: hypothetical protein GVY09_00685 [Gammaproteobacteria bacterium]|nr:hypothetical protein [Gammaproteobacteria bacterium]